jgi:hypothetical protein
MTGMMTADMFQVGQMVTLESETHLYTAAGNGPYTLSADTPYEITQVSTNKVKIEAWVDLHWGGQRDYKFWIVPDNLKPADPDTHVRKLGEVPEGGIAPDDPRLAWLWEDAAKFAQKKGYCGQYDALTSALGIPGREREFKITTTVAGLEIKTSIRARSKQEAEEKVRVALASPAPEVSAEDTVSVA